ncbi:hypothetical protein PSACC_01085 [Paramicrosporidium saccamoebae]|uniref:EB1 C-terminal domain-containing protein n=1 Tax=Paramicrosporidium saccamoebae TaxID=1246581 RepID=A0A2H9TMZ8_9FUNG|nr:hypothetical protein PSACC_01085 [Paramicrosporidium saccamoebae]
MATAAAANESRGDLLSWINDLLQLNVSKIEQVGTGAVLCDVQMHKVKFNTIQEYEYVNNFKVLQSCFTLHGLDKFQDNLEFLQWMKKFWDSNYPGGSYDAIARRKGLAVKTVSRSSASLVGAQRINAATPPATPSTVSHFQQTINHLNNDLTTVKLQLDEMEKERDFYFNKLRDIEIITQQVTDSAVLESEMFKCITEVLYKTEDGFEIPQEMEGGAVVV